VSHGVIDVFAFQEALLMMAVFGIAILTMVWVGFRRWLQHKEKMGQLIAEQIAEHGGQHGGDIARVEARLKAIEQMLTDGRAQIDTPRTDPQLNADEPPAS